jgi:signal transduction histidine kinase
VRISTSTIRNAVLPLLLAIAIFAGLVTQRVMSDSRSQALAHEQERAESVLVAVQTVAEMSSSTDLHRAVMMLAADPIVEEIVVVRGEPAVVEAASRYEWLGMTASVLPEDIQAQLTAGAGSFVPVFRHDEEGQTISAAGSLRNLKVAAPGFSLSDLRGYVALDLAELTRNLGSGQSLGLLVLLLGGLLVIGVVALWLQRIPLLANRRLSRQLSEKNQFLSSVGHELRTPLTAVTGFARVLQDEWENLPEDERREMVSVIVRQGGDLGDIIEDLLVSGRVEAGVLRLEKMPVDLPAEAANVIEGLTGGTDRSFESVGEQVWAQADPTRVRQVMRNLLTNALKYGGRQIKVETVRQDSLAMVRVIDDGTGVPEDMRERIFQPFQRAHGAVAAAQSLGLGLAISRQLARAMGGDLTYRYDGGHSIFELAVPVFDPAPGHHI